MLNSNIDQQTIQWVTGVKVLAAEPDDLSYILRTHMEEEEKQLPQAVL